MTTNRDEIERALAFFESTTDVRLLRETLRAIRPRAARAVASFERRGQPVPPPREISPASEAATQADALRTVSVVSDFGELQALARTIGRRIEALGGVDGRPG